MKVESDKTLKIKLKGDDISDLKSALKKVIDENSKIGFSKCLTEAESKVIKDLSDKM